MIPSSPAALSLPLLPFSFSSFEGTFVAAGPRSSLLMSTPQLDSSNPLCFLNLFTTDHLKLVQID